MQQENRSMEKSRSEVEVMFNSIARHYDFLNHFLSFGTDRFWRRRAINTIGRHLRPSAILDVATGTADLAICSLRLNPDKVTGIDISESMLELGRKKIADKNLGEKIELFRGDSEAIQYKDGTFDVAMSAFGVRNFENTLKGLSEMCRVLREGGMIMILEFSRPAHFPFRQAYKFYFTRVLPWVGKKVSGDIKAYSYLPDSVMNFPDNEDFMKLLLDAGFGDVHQIRLSGGIASIYYGFKT
jgi:demethylmenaquinone methyltransferase / 2-methoxy-6-polyprenyl-1,4-benzoquinol methylase